MIPIDQQERIDTMNLMNNGRITLILASIFFSISCVSTKTQEEKKVAAANQVLGFESPSLEQLQAQPDFLQKLPKPQVEKANLRSEFQNICKENPELCQQRQTRRNTRTPSLSRSEIISALLKKDVEKLAELTAGQVTSTLHNQSQARVMEMASGMPANDCKMASARFGTALTLEKWLPDEKVFETAINLYSQNQNCPETYDVNRSNLRFSLLQISKSQCPVAEKSLRRLQASTDSSFKSRGIFWLKECGLSTDISENDFPFLSFHGLKAKSQFQMVTTPLAVDSATPVQFRLGSENKFDQLLGLIETSLIEKEQTSARWMTEQIDLNYLRTLPAEIQIYFAYLCFMSGSHLRKLQVLNPLVHADVRFQTKAVKDLLFPWIYSEEVAAQNPEVPVELIMALIRQESAFDLRARSPVGATGLMQLMYSTARLMDRSVTKKDLLDPQINIALGTKYFQRMHKSFAGSNVKALAAYNAGPLRVVEWEKRYQTTNDLLFAELIPFNETRDYVALVLRNFYIYQEIKLEKDKVSLTQSR